MFTVRKLTSVLFATVAFIFWKSLSSTSTLSSAWTGSGIWRPAAPKHAFATFLSTRVKNESEIDPYFVATRTLIYQLLHNPETRIRREGTPVLVLVLPHVSEVKRAILRQDGATVVPVDLINPQSWIPCPGTERWVDQFAKLQLFSLTQYDRIVYLDNDMLLTRPLDEIWNENVVVNPQKTQYERFNVKHEYINPRALPEEYVFAGVIDYQGPGGKVPEDKSGKPYTQLNAGFFVLKPDEDILAYYLSVLNHDKALFDEGFMEQSLLNYAHRDNGPMPWTPLPARRYNTNYPQLDDLKAGSATLHDKFWWYHEKDWIDRELVDMWWRVQGRMEGYWQCKDGSKHRT